MKISGSKMGLARLCQYWARDDVEWPEQTTGDAAAIGTWYHDVAAATINGTDAPPTPAVVGDACELTPIDDAQALEHELLKDGFEPTLHVWAEEAYAYSPSGTRYIGHDIGRDYGVIQPDEIPCSLDVVALKGSHAVVVDWKTGRRENTEPAATNAQLAFGALCVAKYHGVLTVEVQLRFGDGFVDRHDYTVFDLMDVAAEVDAIISMANNEHAVTPPQPGLHCTSKWCPIRATCPETVAALAEVMDGEPVEPDDTDMVIVFDAAAITSPEHAGHMYHRAAAARALLDSVDAAVKAYVDTHGAVPLGDGKEYRVVEETRESITGNSLAELYEPVSEFITPEQFAAVTKTSVPKAALEKAIKATVTTRGNKGTIWGEALDALRTAGRVKSKTTSSHRVRTAK